MTDFISEICGAINWNYHPKDSEITLIEDQVQKERQIRLPTKAKSLERTSALL